MIAKANKLLENLLLKFGANIKGPARLNPLDCRNSCPQDLLKLDKLTYESSDFTSIFGGTFHENLGQYVLQEKHKMISV